MLVLTRKLGEKIHIGPDITLTVVDVNGGRIRLGIEAPQQVSIFRAELLNVLGRVGTETAAPTHCLEAAS
jgi:carbon storage regulator